MTLTFLPAVLSAVALLQTQPAPSLQEETSVPDITVTGGTLEQQARAFVQAVAQPAPGRGLARWTEPVCVGVVNFRPATARVIADTIVTTAADLGVAIADSPCEPDLFIVGAVDGRELAEEWVRTRRDDFAWNVSGSHGSASALERFRTSDDPVRWWHVSLPMHYDVASGQADRAVRLPIQAVPAEDPPYPMFWVYARSQIRGSIRDDLLRTVVIVDVGKAERLTMRQLCDYLTMIAFAQVDPEADMSAYPTILNVFDKPEGEQALTDWDRAYLRALYSADETHRLTPDGQAAGLAAGMAPTSDSPTP